MYPFALTSDMAYNCVMVDQPDQDIDIKPQSTAAELRLENMAYATQSTVLNLGANIVEPFINLKWQKHHALKDPEFKDYGNWWQNFGGEIAGDIGGGGLLFMTSALAPNLTQGFINFTGRLVHPIYFAMGHAAFKDEFNEPDYMAKVHKWTRFQERNFARGLIVTVGGIAANVTAQKYVLRNPSPFSVILAGKSFSAGLTTAVMWGSRIFFPQKMRDLDQRMGAKFNGDDKPNKTHDAISPALPKSFAERVRTVPYTDHLQQFSTTGYPTEWTR